MGGVSKKVVKKTVPAGFERIRVRVGGGKKLTFGPRKGYVGKKRSRTGEKKRLSGGGETAREAGRSGSERELKGLRREHKKSRKDPRSFKRRSNVITGGEKKNSGVRGVRENWPATKQEWNRSRRGGTGR